MLIFIFYFVEFVNADLSYLDFYIIYGLFVNADRTYLTDLTYRFIPFN